MCGFRHHTIHAVYLKSAMQRLEQGDVVTETQLARQGRHAEGRG